MADVQPSSTFSTRTYSVQYSLREEGAYRQESHQATNKDVFEDLATNRLQPREVKHVNPTRPGAPMTIMREAYGNFTFSETSGQELMADEDGVP